MRKTAAVLLVCLFIAEFSLCADVLSFGSGSSALVLGSGVRYHRIPTHPVRRGRKATHPIRRGRKATHPIRRGRKLTHPVRRGRKLTHPVRHGRHRIGRVVRRR